MIVDSLRMSCRGYCGIVLQLAPCAEFAERKPPDTCNSEVLCMTKDPHTSTQLGSGRYTAFIVITKSKQKRHNPPQVLTYRRFKIITSDGIRIHSIVSGPTKSCYVRFAKKVIQMLCA